MIFIETTMPSKRTRTPQEKKRLSLERDRRNTYGENAKSSRKNIPKSKALANRKIRHAAKQSLAEDSQDESDAVLMRQMRNKWRKWRDKPLGDVLARKKAKN